MDSKQREETATMPEEDLQAAVELENAIEKVRAHIEEQIESKVDELRGDLFKVLETLAAEIADLREFFEITDPLAPFDPRDCHPAPLREKRMTDAEAFAETGCCKPQRCDPGKHKWRIHVPAQPSIGIVGWSKCANCAQQEMTAYTMTAYTT